VVRGVLNMTIGYKKDGSFAGKVFKKGQVPWNKGKKGLQVAWNKGKETPLEVRKKQSEKRMGKTPWNKGKFDLDTYYGLHNWVKKKRGNADECEKCGKTNHVGWCNKSNEYKKDLNDWLKLCKKCHWHHDKNHFGSMKKIYG
jgi:hypothetical protein